MRVGHSVRRYPVPDLGYISDQVRPERGDFVVADRGRGQHVAARRTLPTTSAGARVAQIADRLRDRVQWGSNALATVRFLKAELESRDVDIVHAHFGMAGAQLASAGALPRPLVTTFYGVDASACLRDPVWLRRFEPLWDVGSAFIVLTQAVVPRLIKAGAAEDRVHVWNIGIDFTPYAIATNVGEREGPFKILCAARFVEKKGHRVLVEGFARLRRERSAKLTLLGYGPLLPQIRSQVNQLGLRPDVTVIDTSGRDDFTSLYSSLLHQHDVFTLPSTVAADGDDEGGPALTAVCAQATATPVILTHFAGAERSVEDGVTGLLCDYDPASLAECMVRLADDRKLAQSIGQAAAQHVRADFSLDGQLRKLETIYQKAAEEWERRRGR